MKRKELIMSNCFPRGSEWRIWDLHIHSPLSIVQEYGGDQPGVWDNFFATLEGLPKDISVIGINDYYFIDGYERVMKEKLEKGRLRNITKVFPMLEFRIDTFGAASASAISKVNLHILFDIDENNLAEEIKKVREEFIGQIHISKLHPTVPLSIDNLIKHSSKGNLKTGFANFIPDTDEVFKLIDSPTWKNKTIIFLGYNEWHSLDVGKQVQPTKEDLYKRANFFLTASQADCTSKKAEVLARFGSVKLLHSRDFHSINDFKDYKCLTWIKADPTFEGFRHVFIESDSRLYLGEKPPKLLTEENNRQLLVDSVEIYSEKDSGEWFDKTGTIVFNSGLNVIIGNKGSGKSALTDILGLVGNCHNGNYSFLNKSKFLALPVHKKYSAKVLFRDNYANRCAFHGACPDLEKAFKVIYLSQSFVNDLCDHVDGTKKLQIEIDRVIFSHIPQEDKLGQADLQSLIAIRAKVHTDMHEELCREMVKINTEIVEIEDMLSESSRAKFKNALDERIRQLEDVDKTEKPIEIKPPSDTVTHRFSELSQKYKALQLKLQSASTSHQAKLNANSISIQSIRDILAEIDAVSRDYQEISQHAADNSILQHLQIDFSSILKLEVNKEPLLKIIADLETANVLIRKKKNKTDSLYKKISLFIVRLEQSLSVEQKNYQKYLSANETWKAKIQGITGNEDTPDTIVYLKKHILALDTHYPTRLSELNSNRAIQSEKIVTNIRSREKELSDIYSFVQSEANRIAGLYKIPQNEFIVFDTNISLSSTFPDDFLSYVNQNRTGTFYRTEDGIIALGNILQSVSSTEYSKVPVALIQALQHNVAANPAMDDHKYATTLESQLKKPKLELYNYLFSFEYLKSHFTFKYDSKNLMQLSPGEKGILLLIFFLLIDQNKIPIIIDQPEENLDNETVYRRLVSFLKDCKNQRQIIIVTHNPNLAVVCDSEELISCEMDKTNSNKITYYSGSIENPKIKDHILRILEGTRPAFDNRQSKYDI